MRILIYLSHSATRVPSPSPSPQLHAHVHCPWPSHQRRGARDVQQPISCHSTLIQTALYFRAASALPPKQSLLEHRIVHVRIAHKSTFTGLRAFISAPCVIKHSITATCPQTAAFMRAVLPSCEAHGGIRGTISTAAWHIFLLY